MDLNRRQLFRSSAALAAVGLTGCAAASRALGEAESQAGPRFDHLKDESGAIDPIQGSEHRARRVRLGKILTELGADALICESGSTMTYLSGFSWGTSERLFALVVLADGAHFWLCPAFEESKARRKLDGSEGANGPTVVWLEHEYPYRPLAAALRERRATKVLVEPELRWIFGERLAETIGRENVASGQLARLKLRGRKDAHETALLRRANELTQRAIVEVAKTLEPGLTGADIASRIDRAHGKLGMKDPWALCLIGPAAALPHGDDHDMRLERGSVLLMDVGASLHGYQSDGTRTWVFDGAPTREVERAWNSVRDAQLRAFELVRPGTACRDVDAAARAVLADRGYGSGYAALTHRLGHGIGLQGHEDPYFDGGSEVVLEPGMTLSNEPGIYVPGHFGIRLEDIVLVTSDGGDHFGDWQKSPTWPA